MQVTKLSPATEAALQQAASLLSEAERQQIATHPSTAVVQASLAGDAEAAGKAALAQMQSYIARRSAGLHTTGIRL